MAQKPEIQYIGQFYIHGSEAKVLELQQKKAEKQAKAQLPTGQVQRTRRIQIDWLALCSMVLATVFLVSMVAGTLSMQAAWKELEIARQYVTELEVKNEKLLKQYQESYDLEEVHREALSMGMIPAEEAKTMKIRVTLPQPEPEPSLLDEIAWAFSHLFKESPPA